MSADTSFYLDGEAYDTSYTTSVDSTGSSTPSQAPSSFYPSDGGIYQALVEESATATLFQQLLASTQAAQAAAAASAAAAAASAASVPVASTSAPLVNGTASAGTVNAWSHGDHVHPTDTSRAPLVSPALTGTPTAPTPTAGDNSTKLATTAFVLANSTSVSPATVAPLIDGTAAVGTSLLYARQDHVHPTDTSRAPLVSPTFTGVPAAPTATVGTNTTQLATTAFVLANGTSLGSTTPVMDGTGAAGTATVAARSDHVHPTDTSRAPLASPSFTGTVASSGVLNVTNATASTGTSTGAIVASGGLGVAGDVHANSYTPHAAPSSKWGMDLSGNGGNTITVSASSSAVLPVGSGLIMLTDSTTTGQTGLYLNGGSLTSAAVLLAGGSAYVAPTTTPAAGKYSVGFDGTNWRIYNGAATSITFFCGLIRNRNTN